MATNNVAQAKTFHEGGPGPARKPAAATRPPGGPGRISGSADIHTVLVAPSSTSLRREARRAAAPFAVKHAGPGRGYTLLVVDADQPYALVPLAPHSPGGLPAHSGQVIVVNRPAAPSRAGEVDRQLCALNAALAARPAPGRHGSAGAAPDTPPAGPAVRAANRLRRQLASQPAAPAAATAPLTPEQVRQGWLDAGLLVGSEALAAAWSRTRQALDAMCERGELLGTRHKNRRCYPAGYQGLSAADVAQICQAIGAGQTGHDPVAQLMFLMQPQPADNSHTVLDLWASQRQRAQQYLTEFNRLHPALAAG